MAVTRRWLNRIVYGVGAFGAAAVFIRCLLHSFYNTPPWSTLWLGAAMGAFTYLVFALFMGFGPEDDDK